MMNAPFCRYGFDYGSVHFVLMSTEHNFTQGSPQYQFLDQHMQGVDRSKTPWLIFAGHRLGGTIVTLHFDHLKLGSNYLISENSA